MRTGRVSREDLALNAAECAFGRQEMREVSSPGLALNESDAYRRGRVLREPVYRPHYFRCIRDAIGSGVSAVQTGQDGFAEHEEIYVVIRIFIEHTADRIKISRKRICFDRDGDKTDP